MKVRYLPSLKHHMVPHRPPHDTIAQISHSPAWGSQVLALALYQRCGCDCIRRICQLNVTSPRWSDSGPPLRLSHTDRDRSCAPYPRLMTFTRWDKTERTTPNLILKMLSHDSLQTLHEHKYQLIPNQHCVQSGRFYLQNATSKGNLMEILHLLK